MQALFVKIYRSFLTGKRRNRFCLLLSYILCFLGKCLMLRRDGVIFRARAVSLISRSAHTLSILRWTTSDVVLPNVSLQYSDFSFVLSLTRTIIGEGWQNKRAIYFTGHCSFYQGLYSSRSEIEQFSVSHILTNTSMSNRVIVLLRQPLSCERCNSALWQNLFLLSPASWSNSFR